MPNRIVNVASSSAIQNAVSARIGTGSLWAGMTTSGYWTRIVKLFDDGLQLQRDVGNDPDHRDDRDEPGEERALAVARRDEVGERRDAVRLADADDLAHHEPPQRHHQRRADVDRQEADAVGRRAPDAAVERPRGRVDAERQRVDVRIGDDRAALVRPLVAVVGDREQDRRGSASETGMITQLWSMSVPRAGRIVGLARALDRPARAGRSGSAHATKM